MNPIVKGFIDLGIRHALTLIGGFVLAHGYLTQNEWTQGAAAIMTLVGLFWSAQNHLSTQATIAAHQQALAEARAEIQRTGQ